MGIETFASAFSESVGISVNKLEALKAFTVLSRWEGEGESNNVVFVPLC